jgi:hypothetical protein
MCLLVLSTYAILNVRVSVCVSMLGVCPFRCVCVPVCLLERNYVVGHASSHTHPRKYPPLSPTHARLHQFATHNRLCAFAICSDRKAGHRLLGCNTHARTMNACMRAGKHPSKCTLGSKRACSQWLAFGCSWEDAFLGLCVQACAATDISRGIRPLVVNGYIKFVFCN